MSPVQSLPPAAAWVVPLVVIGLVVSGLLALVVVRLLRRLTRAVERTEELEARVELLETEVDDIRGRASSTSDRRPDETDAESPPESE